MAQIEKTKIMNSKSNLTQNIQTYNLYRLFGNLMIIGPILVPFMLFKGLNYAQIMLLQSISALAVFVFEVPTGAIADKVSRKFSLVLSGFFFIFGLFMYIITNSFLLFAFAEILFGIGLTLRSGADSAILYESLCRLDRQKEYQKVEGHAASLAFMGQALGSVVSGFIYKFDHYLPFWVSIGFISVAAIFAFRFTDSEPEKSEHNYLVHIFKSAGIAFKTPRILWTVVFAAFMGFIFRTSFWLYQPYFKQVNIDVQWFGIIFFFFNIVAAFASKYLVHRHQDRRPRQILLVLAGIITISFLVPALFISKFMIMVLAMQQIVRGMYQPTLKFYINHQIGDQYRATVISLVSLSGSLGFALLSPVVGLSLDKVGTIPTYLWMGIVALSGTLLLILMRRLQKLKKRRSEL